MEQLPKFLETPNPEIFNSKNYLVLDFETTSIEKGSPLNDLNRILLACWRFNGQEKSKRGGENEQRELLLDIKRADFIVAHFAKFELQWLRRCGLDLRDVIVYDTFLAQWVIDGNKQNPRDLDSLAKRYGIKGKEDQVAKLIQLGVNPENIPCDWLKEYCHQDVSTTDALFNVQLSTLRNDRLLHLVYQRGLVCACLSDIEFSGLALDKERVLEEYERVYNEHESVSRQLDEFGQINWRSTKQLGEFIYGDLGFKPPATLTATGRPPTDKATLGSLTPENKRQQEFVELFKKKANLNAKLTKSLDFFKGICEQYNNIFYGQFNQGRTSTHRLSASGRSVDIRDNEGKTSAKGAQFQNLPREYKRLFRAKRKGWLILETDGAQLEFRAAADLGRDEVALDEIKNGTDIHAVTAKTLTDAGEPTSRQEAKSRTFRPLYGGSSGTPAEQAYCKFFQEKYKGIYDTQTKWVNEVLRTKKLITPYGIHFYWPDTKLTGSGYVTNTTAIFNFPIQGFATAEIIPLALVCFWHRTKNLKLEIVNTVHDSVISEVHPDSVEEAKEVAKTAFTSDVYHLLDKLYNYQLVVPLGVETKVGRHWSEGESTKYDYAISSD